ncbi:MAG: DUF389 domain-containing protein [Bacteroidales bacterium]|nr:DUF389 domain-containing protein [Bacteroidales bacterium]
MEPNNRTEDAEKNQELKRKILYYDFKNFLKSSGEFLKEIMSIKEGTDIPGTIESIKKDMVFRGPTVWILIASIFIASIGLNVGSIPVVIGAMLISPLMGPILAIGVSVGTNDWETLMRALKNFGIAIVVSLITSTILFMLSPLKEASAELISRTKPTILDVLIAAFGGLAGIVAGSRREKSNVVPGVAIATALMPPLCTAGYGLATLQFNFFFGAFYLFFINTVFISLSTYLIVKYLHFPQKSFVDPKREQKIKRYMIIFIIIVILPSAKIFTEVLRESSFHSIVNKYIKENFNFEGSEIINQKSTYSDTLSVIDVYIIGEKIDKNRIEYLNEKMEEYGLTKGKGWFGKKLFGVTDKTLLRVHQGNDDSDTLFSQMNYLENNLSKEIRIGIIEDIYRKNEEIIYSKDQQIKFLEDQIVALKKDTIPIQNISKEVMIQFPKIIKFGYGKTIESNSDNETDTLISFMIMWNGYSWRKERQEQKEILEKWLKVRLNLDTLRVMEY